MSKENIPGGTRIMDLQHAIIFDFIFLLSLSFLVDHTARNFINKDKLI